MFPLLIHTKFAQNPVVLIFIMQSFL